MKTLISAIVLTFAGTAFAQGANCNTEANARKLTGATKAEFLKKCEANMKAKLVLSSKERNYSVAPTSSYGGCEHGASDL